MDPFSTLPNKRPNPKKAGTPQNDGNVNGNKPLKILKEEKKNWMLKRQNISMHHGTIHWNTFTIQFSWSHFAH